MRIARGVFTGMAAMAFGTFCQAAQPQAKLSLEGNWKVAAELESPSGKILKESFDIEPLAAIAVSDERCEKLPDFNPKAWGGWQKGYALKKLKAQECAVKGALLPLSLKVKASPGASAASLTRGKDFEADLDWGSVGRLPGGELEEAQTVFISYECMPQRIDSIVLSADGGSLLLRKGAPDMVCPKPPALQPGETPLANVYQAGRLSKLNPECLYEIGETEFPEALSAQAKGSAEKLLPKTMAKLRSGEPLRILAWGDSVTDGGFLPEKEKNRWQAQFVERLKAKYPAAKIELLTEAWGGHNTDNYFAEPPGALHNYQEKVLALKPDLIVSEFVNDSSFKTPKVEERYGRILADFKGIGAEWIVLTPHYVRPDWMGLRSQRNIDEDPREYVKALRAFAAANGVALADASARYGRLWRQGVPYLTLMSNNINHPEPRGMKIFADALGELFP